MSAPCRASPSWPDWFSARAFVEGLVFIEFSVMALRILADLAMTLPVPFADHRLAAWDAALGLDWQTYARWIMDHPNLNFVVQTAYARATGIAFVAFVALFLTGRVERARELVWLVLATCLGTTAIAPWLPALGTVKTLGDQALQRVFEGGMYFVQPIIAMHGLGPVTLDIHQVPGLCSFPSFHTATGIIVAWACRGHWYLAIPATIYAAFMIAATPLYGGHYFVDLIGGAALTAVSILLYRHSETRGIADRKHPSRLEPATADS